MKTVNMFVLVLVLLVLPCSAHADLLSQYGLNISDSNMYNDNVNLYQLFNNYFADQLGESGLYKSSNDLFNDRGVDPYTDWTTNGSQLVGAFKVAALGHEMSMTDTDQNVVASLIHVGGTVNIGATNGITDLSGQKVLNVADGLTVNFQLDAYWGNDLVYAWSSNPNGNDGSLGKVGDNMIHMIALDITDLYNMKYGTNNNSVYMFGWEDLHLTGLGGGSPADWDYQDFVAILTNVKPTSSATPEPASMLIFGLGGAFAGVFAYRRRTNKNGK